MQGASGHLLVSLEMLPASLLAQKDSQSLQGSPIPERTKEGQACPFSSVPCSAECSKGHQHRKSLYEQGDAQVHSRSLPPGSW